MRLLRHRRISPIASPDQFRALYEQNRLSVFRYIFSLTGGPQEDVEDLTAETFLRAWKARKNYQGETNRAIGWLIRIAKRLVIDQYRRNSTRMKLAASHIPALDPMPEQAAIAEEQQRLVLAMLADLPDQQREIIVLRYMLGWRVNDIAQPTGASENYVSVTIHRTLAKLRGKWHEADSGGIPAVFAQEEKTP